MQILRVGHSAHTQSAEISEQKSDRRRSEPDIEALLEGMAVKCEDKIGQKSRT
jgi:hypothetical protein